MAEKLITLENIGMLDFVGVGNRNIKEVAAAFPKSRIISRGHEVLIKGNDAEIIQISDILQSLINHYHKYGKVTKENVRVYLNRESGTQAISDDNEILIYGIGGAGIKPKTANQRSLVEAVRDNDLVFAVGAAGSGKTFISVAMAVRALKSKQVQKIIITRPAVEAGEHLGFLPGELKEKIDPYLRPVYDALNYMIPAEKLLYYQKNNIVEIAPLAYMRGRTLNNAFVLLDEAQNTTAVQMKMFLTRMGPNAKVIVTGDHSQTDLPFHQKSGLAEAIGLLKQIKGIAVVTFDTKDVVRHQLVREIISAYDKQPKRNDSCSTS